MREDKKPAEIILEKAQSTFKFKLTHPEKILYPEDKITKQMVADYYVWIAPKILPFIRNRPLSIVRCPENYQKSFYQKHINGATPKEIFGTKLDKDIYIKDVAGLMTLIQLGTLEIHPWGSQISHVDSPDVITFDLDPAPEVKWSAVVEAAFLIKSYLEKINLVSFVKTTGGKGLHVVVPIKPNHHWAAIKNFTHTFVDYIVAQAPKKYIAEMSKVKRKGKIFIDYLRNQRGATSVSAYATRARIHAPISTPLAWDELTDHFDDTFYTLQTLPQRLNNLKVDPWQEFFNLAQRINLDK